MGKERKQGSSVDGSRKFQFGSIGWIGLLTVDYCMIVWHY